MSASPPPPRRSQRDKKSFKPFDSGNLAPSCASGAHAEPAAASSGRKRKRREGEDEDDAQHATERDSHRLSDDGQDAGEEDEGEGEGEDGGADEEEEEEYRTPKAKASGAGRKGKGKATPKAKPAAPVKKPRKTRVAKAARGAAGSQADQQAKDTNIASDNVLFSEFPTRYFTRWHVHLTPRRCPSQPCRATSVHRRRLYRVVAPNTGSCTSRAGEPYSALLWVQRLCRR